MDVQAISYDGKTFTQVWNMTKAQAEAQRNWIAIILISGDFLIRYFKCKNISGDCVRDNARKYLEDRSQANERTEAEA